MAAEPGAINHVVLCTLSMVSIGGFETWVKLLNVTRAWLHSESASGARNLLSLVVCANNLFLVRTRVGSGRKVRGLQGAFQERAQCAPAYVLSLFCKSSRIFLGAAGKPDLEVYRLQR